MPFKSESQRRKFFAMASRGEISDAKVQEWQDATGDRQLPERVSTKKAQFLKMAYGMGRNAAFEKNSNIPEWIFGKGVDAFLPLIATSGAGALLAGPEHRPEGALAGLLGGLAGKALIGRGLASRIGAQKPAAELAKEFAGNPDAKHLIEAAQTAATRIRNTSDWAGRLAGAGAAGMGIKYMNTPSADSNITSNAAPANYDIGGRYTGLYPEADLSDALLGI